MLNVGLRTLCNALGFMAVVIRDDVPKKDSGRVALRLAGLIEEFCQVNDTGKNGESDNQNGDALELHQHMAVAIAAIIKETGTCIPRDLEAKGFTAEEIERCWAMARALAQVMLGMTDA